MDDDKFLSRCDESQTADDTLLVTPSAPIDTGNDTDEAEALPRFSLLGAKIDFKPAQVGPLYFPRDQELRDLARASSTQNVTTIRRLETLLEMHKRLVIAIVHSGNELPGIRQLQQLHNVTVFIQPTIDSLCEQLHEVAHQERTQGYELPSPRACSSDTSAGDLEASFTSRLQFSRTLTPLSLYSALSLSFRFKNFTENQVPVLRLM
ncbi:hypothetical protein PsorP6_012985 [Peronosclerospora sorghi]|uniref:Uncharacterized protein n=1 Tax=Peronosclerospora sorghi TaxID=230839 RepID=A0ACC0WF96_9STRA|nr:hypothetical protein PsorP6_012985 [Peronosclerospora sorghi]